MLYPAELRARKGFIELSRFTIGRRAVKLPDCAQNCAQCPPHIVFVADIIPVEHAASFVARHLHRHSGIDSDTDDCEIHIGAELGDTTISDFANLFSSRRTCVEMTENPHLMHESPLIR